MDNFFFPNNFVHIKSVNELNYKTFVVKNTEKKKKKDQAFINFVNPQKRNKQNKNRNNLSNVCLCLLIRQIGTRARQGQVPISLIFWK